MTDTQESSAPRGWRAAIIRMGRLRAVLVITVFATLASVALTCAMGVGMGFERREFEKILLIGMIAPAVIAPMAAYFLIQFLYELERARAELLSLASRDSLTQLYNRRYFMDRLAIEVKRSVRTDEPLSLMLIDVDGFKLINDEFGHSIGDHVLREIARECGGTLRIYDVLARYGGEEFVVLMPSTTLANACTVAERMRAAVAAMRIDTNVGATINPTVSLGISSLIPSDPQPEHLIDRADAALYEAKRTGRNRWVTG